MVNPGAGRNPAWRTSAIASPTSSEDDRDRSARPESRLKDKRISVQVSKQIVTAGRARSTPAAQKRAAEQIALQAPGVQTWSASSTVADGAAAAESVDDRLARRVEFELYSTKAVSLKMVQIRSQDGTVVLSGSVPSRAEKLLAERVAQSVEGVKKVVNNLNTQEPAAVLGDRMHTRADVLARRRRRRLAAAALARARRPRRRAGVRRNVRSVRDHGAPATAQTLDTRRAAGRRSTPRPPPGARAHFPPGTYRSGTVRLRSHVTIQLAAGATLVASPDDADFDPVEELGYESFADAETSSFQLRAPPGTGPGGRPHPRPGPDRRQPESRDGPKPIALKECRQIELRDVTIANSGNYNVSLLGCDGVDIRRGHHPERLLGRHRPGRLPGRPDRGLSHRHPRRRDRDQDELRAGVRRPTRRVTVTAATSPPSTTR